MLHLFVSHKNVPFGVNIDCDLVNDEEVCLEILEASGRTNKAVNESCKSEEIYIDIEEDAIKEIFHQFEQNEILKVSSSTPLGLGGSLAVLYYVSRVIGGGFTCELHHGEACFNFQR